MKRFFILSILSVIAFSLQAQDYSFSKNEIDMFTETVIKEVEVRIIDRNHGYQNPDLTIGINGNNLYLKFKFFANFNSTIYVSEKDPIEFRFENKETVSFFPKKPYFYVNALSKRTYLEAQYNIEYSQLKRFSEQKINMIRINFNNINNTYTVNSIEKENIVKMAKTIMSIVKSNQN